MNRKLTRKSSITVLALTGTLAAVGVGYAAIPGSGGVIHSCYSNAAGQLRVIDTEAGAKCAKNETALDFNEQGPKGDEGPPGETGPSARDEVLFAKRSWNVNDLKPGILDKTLPAGSYVVEAQVNAQNGPTGDSPPKIELECAMYDMSDREISAGNIILTPAHTGGDSKHMTLTTAFTHPGGVLRLTCFAGNHQFAEVHVSLIATKVASVE